MTRPLSRILVATMALGVVLVTPGAFAANAMPSHGGDPTGTADPSRSERSRLADKGEDFLLPDVRRGGTSEPRRERDTQTGRRRSLDGEDGRKRRDGGAQTGRRGARDGADGRRHRDGKRRDGRHRGRRHRDGGFDIYISPYPYYYPYYDPYYEPYYEPYDDRPARMSCETVRRIVEDAGYRRVRADDCRGDIYGFFAVRRGVSYYVNVNSRTGRIVNVLRRR